MSSDGKEDHVEGRYSQHDGQVRMSIQDGDIYLDFRLENNPASSVKTDEPGYNFWEIKSQEEEQSNTEIYPEMDFRALSSVTNTQYLTHSIHKHPAVFIPQIPNYIINEFTSELNNKGERPLVLDPFSGSGTTGIEAKIAGRDYLGIEINPLSKLVSEVATSPIPPSIISSVGHQIEKIVNSTEEKTYEEFSVEFPGRTSLEHWFEPRAIRDLSRIRQAVSDYIETSPSLLCELSPREASILRNIEITEEDLHDRIRRWLVLMIANTVFDVSNADPMVSKAHKSSTMREKISKGEHPPRNIIQLYTDHLEKSSEKLLDFWEAIYDARDYEDDTEPILSESLLEQNHKHRARIDIQLGDAREFDFRSKKRAADIAITSPPYINAINYYRGTKLRLFWISDLLETCFDYEKLRHSIVGTNSSGIGERNPDLPAKIRDIWGAPDEEFERTALTELDDEIEAIHNSSLTESRQRGYITWRFFAEDMLRSVSRTYEHLRPGAYFFLLIGENTIGGHRIQSHRYVADIAQNLGKFDNRQSYGDFDTTDGFRLVGTAIDEISTRELFEERNHRSGVIEKEWVVILQKPPQD